MKKTLNSIISECVRKALLSEAYGTKEINATIKRLYKNVEKSCSVIYRDEGWSSLDIVIDAIRKTEGVTDVNVYVKNGGYHNYMVPGKSPYKQYELEIDTPFGENTIGGVMRANSAGTFEEPFSSYDVTCSFWRNGENQQASF